MHVEFPLLNLGGLRGLSGTALDVPRYEQRFTVLASSCSTLIHSNVQDTEASTFILIPVPLVITTIPVPYVLKAGLCERQHLK